MTVSKILNLSGPQMGIRATSQVFVRLSTGNIFMYTCHHTAAYQIPITDIPKSSGLCPSAPSTLFLRCYPLFSPVGTGRSLQDLNQTPSLREASQPCSPGIYRPWPPLRATPTYSPPVTQRSLPLSVTCPFTSPQPEAKFQRGHGQCLMPSLYPSPLGVAYRSHLINLS